MVFSMVVSRRPPSSNRGPNVRFQAALRAEAHSRRGEGVMTGDLYSRITWFHARPTTQDVDNIAKNVHDSLVGVVFEDDVQIVQSLASKVDTRRDYEIDDRGVSSEIFEELITLLAGNHENLLYVEIGAIVSNRVMFGPIDGGKE
jgi:hypothetical protein